MKSVFNISLLLFIFYTLIGERQQAEGGWSPDCGDLVNNNPDLKTCYIAVKDKKPEPFCEGSDIDCIEVLQPFLECVGNETRAKKEQVITELLGKCKILQSEVEANDAATVGAGVVVPAVLVAMAAALN